MLAFAIAAVSLVGQRASTTPDKDIRRFTADYREQEKGNSQMDEEITLVHDGVTYTVSYTVLEDTLTVMVMRGRRS